MWFLYIVDSQDNYTFCGMYDDLEALYTDIRILRLAFKQLKNSDLMLTISLKEKNNET